MGPTETASLGASTHSSTCKRGFLGAAPHLPPGAHLVLGARPPAPRARFARIVDADACVLVEKCGELVLNHQPCLSPWPLPPSRIMVTIKTLNVL